MRRPKDVLFLTLVFIAGAIPASADIIFSDGTFNAANYTQTASFQLNGTITGSQCTGCGIPDPAFQFISNFGDTTVVTGITDLGIVNNTFSYTPNVQGAIASISASVDKDLTINETTSPGNPFGNTFHPLIEQDGNFYLASIPGPTLTGGSTGFNTLAKSGLVAADFQEFDFATDTFVAGTPNFAGDTMLFGLGQISSMGGFPSGGQITAVYDNLNLDVVNTPEPSSIALLASLVLFLGAISVGSAQRRRNSDTLRVR